VQAAAFEPLPVIEAVGILALDARVQVQLVTPGLPDIGFQSRHHGLAGTA